MDKERREFFILFSLVIFSLAVGTAFYNIFEGWSILESLYFSVITLTTVGYGDFSPVTEIGRLFTMVYVFVGIGIIFGFINSLAKRRFKGTFDRHKMREQKLKEKIKEEKLKRRLEKKEFKKKFNGRR